MNQGDQLTATTYVTVPSGDEVEVHWAFSPYDPGVSTGPVEGCYPPEGGECLSCTIPDVTDDGETWLLQRIGGQAFDEAQELAFTSAESPVYERDYEWEPDDDIYQETFCGKD